MNQIGGRFVRSPARTLSRAGLVGGARLGGEGEADPDMEALKPYLAQVSRQAVPTLTQIRILKDWKQ
jgi:hypothetical protein